MSTAAVIWHAHRAIVAERRSHMIGSVIHGTVVHVVRVTRVVFARLHFEMVQVLFITRRHDGMLRMNFAV